MSVSSPVPTTSSSRYQYRCTASHHRTLNVLGKVKNFSKLSLDELGGYCNLMKNESGAQNAAEVADALTARFGWPTTTRLTDIESAWKSLGSPNAVGDEEIQDEVTVRKGSVKDKDDKNVAEKGNEPTISASSIPIIIKNVCWERKVLMCEVDDHEFNILGDSGAVGRISVDPSSLLVDVKGRQYKGLIYSGPTVMLLNLASAVGVSTNSSSYQQTARVEVLTNEYCQLTFEKDLLGSMMGLYSGSMASYDDNQDDEEGGPTKKSKKRGNDDDSDDNGDGDDVSAKLKAPKISTITNRTRTTKKGTKKKPVKTQKSKK